MAVDIEANVDTPNDTPALSSDQMCAFPGCANPRLPKSGGGRPSKFCVVHKPAPRERERSKAQTHRAPGKPATNEPSTKEVASLHDVVSIGVAGLCLFVPPPLHPTTQEVDTIFQPLERIYLRHQTVPTFNPDVPDAMAAIMGIAGYIMRIQTHGGKSLFGGNARSPVTSAANARGVSEPRTRTDGGRSEPDDVHGTQPDAHVAEVMARLHAETFRPETTPSGYGEDAA